MGGSGLIVVVIVAAWALFLVPQWLHRRAEAASRLADRVDETATVADTGDDGAAAPAGPRRRVFGRRSLARRRLAPSAGRRWWRGPVRRSARPATPTATHPARSAAARRRRVLSLLALATLLAAAAVGIGLVTGLPVPAWLVAVPGGLMVGYLVLLALLRPGAAPTRVSRDLAAPGTDEGDVVPAALTSDATPDTSYRADPAPADASAADPESTWTPVPVPAPTYVTAPRARRVVRTIDLSNPGSWTTEREQSAVAETPLEPAETEVAVAVAEHRRAVGD